jgi:pSer/pThr/pTyr-binding forkhead associated (FHA) protein
MGLRLIIEDYDGETTVVPLNNDEGTVTVGRQESNTIQLTEQNVSRRHAKFSFDGQQWHVEDLSSFNGIRVNGRPVAALAQLDEGDVVQIGDYRLILGSDIKTGETQVNTQRNRAANDDTVIGLNAKTSIVSGEPTRNLSAEEATGIATIELRSSGAPQLAALPDDFAEDTPPASSGRLIMALGLIALVGIVVAVLFLSGDADSPSKSAARADEPAQTVALQQPPLAAPPADAPKPSTALPAAASQGIATQASAAHESDVQAPADAEDLGVAPRDAQDPNADEEAKGSEASAAAKPEVDEDGASDDLQAVDPAKPVRHAGKAAAALSQAQEASFAQDFNKARELARRSYEFNPTPDALRILGLSACKLGARKDARWAFEKLRLSFRSGRAEQIRNDLQHVCASHGINLGP